MRQTGGKWVLLLVSTSIVSQWKDGGRSFGVCVPSRNGERDCETKECRASFMPWFLNLFIYISHTWPGQPANIRAHVCAWACLMSECNANSLNCNIYSIQCMWWSMHFQWDSDLGGNWAGSEARGTWDCIYGLLLFDLLYPLLSFTFVPEDIFPIYL